MAKWSKPSFRSIESFGVAGVLADKCQIYYNSLFSARHIGRVSDLLAAKLGERDCDPLRLRALLLFGFFQAYRCSAGVEPGASPLIVECGIDRDRVALGFSFSSSSLPDPELVHRLARGVPAGEFEILLSLIQTQADHLLLRIQRANRKVEIIALFGLAHEKAAIPEKATFELVEIGESAAMAPKAGEYIELGDLDHAGLLPEDKPSRGLHLPSREDAAVAGDPPTLAASKVAGEPEPNDAETHLAGPVDRINDPITRVAGEASEAVGKGSSIKNFFRRLWNPKQNSDLYDQERIRVAASGEAGISPEPGVKAGADSDVEEAAKRLIVEIENGQLDQMINKAQKEYLEVKHEATAGTKRWMDGIMGDLVIEKARLQELARKVSLTVRQKEVEMRNRELNFQEELRRREEMLRQKTIAMSRMKDQLSQASVAMEKLKAASHSASEEGHYKQKYTLANKLLTAAKDENVELNERISELRSQLASAQLVSKSRAPTALIPEFQALQTKLDRATRQAEEFKRANQQLMDRLSEGKKRSGGGNMDEMKKRLEAAIKMATVSKKEAEQLQLRVEELQREEQRLKMELARAHTKPKPGKPSSSSGGGAASAA